MTNLGMNQREGESSGQQWEGVHAVGLFVDRLNLQPANSFRSVGSRAHCQSVLIMK